MFSKNVFVCFPEGRQKVFTLSYDDANIYDKRLVELMRKYGVKGTFNICSGSPRDTEASPDFLGWRLMPLQEAVALYGDDMEIAIHGKNHPHWENLPTNLAMMDILDDRRNLEKASGKIIRGAAYPYGTYNDDVVRALQMCGIAYCRTAGKEATGKLTDVPTDLLRLRATCHHKYEKLPELAEKFVAKTPKSGNWMLYVWGHSFELEQDDNWDVMENLLKTVSHREDIWYATNLEMADYMTAARQLQYNMDETLVYNPTAIPVWLYCKLPQQEKILLQVKPGETLALPE